MLPASDFQFMVAGITAFAATIGYTYARGKFTPTMAGSSDSSERRGNIAPVSQEQGGQGVGRSEITDPAPLTIAPRPAAVQESLKRKKPHDGFEEDTSLGYPHNLSNIYPRKRHCSPTSGKVLAKKPVRESTPSLLLEDPLAEDWTFIHSRNPSVSEPPRTPSPGAETAAACTPTEITDSPLLFTSSIPPHEDSFAEDTVPLVKETESVKEKAPTGVVERKGSETIPPPASATTSAESHVEKPKNMFGAIPVVSRSPFSRPSTNGSPFRTRGFADFAGEKSAFSSFSSSQSSLSKSTVPAWLANNDNEVKDSEYKESMSSHVITQAISAAKPITNHITGEENEDVEMELKNVKLFTKRGDKPFTEGVVGHIKLLADRTTLEERLLFRREPIWKVSMNVRIKPSIRCSYDGAEHILRIIAQEPKAEASTAGKNDPASELEIVAYAMKPSRSCSKQDFKDFAETLLKNSRLMPHGSA